MTAPERRPELAGHLPTLGRTIAAALVLPLLFAAILIWFGSEFRRAESVRLGVRASFERRLDSITLLSRMKDAETAQRGYLLTGDPTFLSPYPPARAAV